MDLSSRNRLASFFVVSIPASLLLDVAYSDRLTADRRPDGSYKLGGSQRSRADRRLKEIGQFIDTPTSSFPNAIILAANYREDDGLIEEEESRKWSLAIDEGGVTGTLQIPARAKLAPIIDGQHRLFCGHVGSLVGRSSGSYWTLGANFCDDSRLWLSFWR